jgi:mRNA interferase MazF
MDRNNLIEPTIRKIKQLPETKIKETYDFAEFLLSKIDDQILQKGIQELASKSNVFSYLNEEEDLYSVNDLKEKYNEKGRLTPFPFSDLSGAKNRTAVILIETDVDVTVAFITTQVKWDSDFDVLLHPPDLNGLQKISLIRLNKLATIDKDLVLGCLGFLDDHSVGLINRNLVRIFQL